MEDERQIDLNKEFGHYASEVQCLDPFKDIDAKKIVQERLHELLEQIEPREDEDASSKTVIVNTAAPIPPLEDISYGEPDPLRNMNSLHYKELIRKARDKNIKLQLCYMYEYRYLLNAFEVGRAKYLLDKKSDDKLHEPLKNGDNLEEYKKYCDMKRMKHYHNMATGKEAVVHAVAMERKRKSTLLSNHKTKRHSSSLCSFLEMGVKCTREKLPSSTFCSKHIINDSKQLLFQTCNTVQNHNGCVEPVMNICSMFTCVLHEKIPMLRD